MQLRQHLDTDYQRQLRLFGSPGAVVVAIVAFALLMALPFLIGRGTLAGIGLAAINNALIAIIGAVALNLLVGFTGLLSMGHAAFFAVGAMAAAIFGTQLELPFPLVLLASGLCGAGIGVIVGLPSLRLSGLYLLLSTLALHFLTLYAFLQYQLYNFGLSGVFYPTAMIGPIEIGTDHRWYFVLVACVVATILIARNVLQSREGRAFVALRDHPTAAAALGVNVAVLRIKAFALSSFLVSVAGALFAFNLGVVTTDAFTLHFVVAYFAMIIIGGMGSLLGSVLGAVVWEFLPQWLASAASNIDPATPVIGDTLARHQAQIISVVMGCIIILVLIRWPAGLAGVVRSTVAAIRSWPYRS